MKILGIDPGTRNLGFCILDFSNNKFKLVEAGVIKFKNIELKERIIELSLVLDKLFTSHVINEVAIENIFFAHNPQSVIKLAQFRGAL
ncbi:MAG: crossover junction endodeoxyribonuclease RuvC, partial [Sulfurovaceae bacterium]|nr:crossover junction endodeoxyribonuclease RuvC [Sulfurovaceae bacterium]